MKRAALFIAAALLHVAARASAEVAGVRAVYETRVGAETQRWSFTRRGNTLEYHFFGPDITERWTQDARGNASYVRVFHRERTAVRYMTGDLLAYGVEPDWLRLTHVVAPPADDGFAKGKAHAVLGRAAQRYQRAFGKKQVEVAWLAELGIPGEVRISVPGQKPVQVRLVELGTEPGASVDLQAFRQIDVTDFGDMERDPFVVRHHEDPLPAAVPTLAVNMKRPARGPLAASAHRH